MGKYEDLSGQIFGRLTILKRSDKTGFVECKCVCGKIKIIRSADMKNKKTTSCGCYQKESHIKRITKHGEHGTKLYMIWGSMIQRCYNPNSEGFKYYGFKGVKVCEEWRDFSAFKKWALENGYGKGLSIDRINVEGNYEPFNCRWATNRQQSENKRTTLYFNINGEIFTTNNLIEKYGIKRTTLMSRVRYGKTGKDLIKGYEERSIG